ncbi:MAG: signal recognition particle-docking protein FtsY [Pseudomonadota bacterium]
MTDEKKPGFLKRIFSFGLGKKNAEAEAAAEAEKMAADQAAKEEAEAREKLEREEAARIVAEKEAAAEALRIEKIEAEQKAKTQAEAKAKREKRRAEEEAFRKEQKAKEEAQKAKEQAEADTKLAEKKAKEEAERLATETAETEAARKRVEEKRAAEKRLQEERVLKERELQEAARLEAEAANKREKAAKAETAEEIPPTPVVPSDEAASEEDRRQGWFKRLKSGLSRSSSNLTENITSVFTKRKLDEDTLQNLEDILIQADLGVQTAMNITDALADQRMGKDVTDEEVRQVMADEIAKTLEPVAKPLELDLEHQPHVILVVGVNGSGKTTTIGKISKKLYDAGFSTLLVAGDTFRAAAIEQLHIWGDRTQAPVMSRKHGADAAALAFDAYTEAQVQKRDVMLMDTAGRLQNKKELMDELEKIIRVLKKQDPAAPHTVLLTLDATTGQNALNQVEIFKDVAGVNGLVMTKLDGTARGGILVSIAAKHKLPVYFIGVGEQVEDLEPFEADVFARAIAGLEVSNE